MEDAGASENDDIDSEDSYTPIDHGHLARNCSIKIITPAVKASVISIKIMLKIRYFSPAARHIALLTIKLLALPPGINQLVFESMFI